MNSRIILSLLLFLFLFNLVSAQIEYVVGDPNEQPNQQITPEGIQEAQEQIRQMRVIANAIDEARAENVANLEASTKFIVEYTDNRLAEMQSTILVITVLTGLCTAGICWAVFLILKSKKLL